CEAGGAFRARPPRNAAPTWLPLALLATCWLATLAERTALEVGHRHLRLHAVRDTAVRDADARVRQKAALAIGHGGPEAAGRAVPELTRALRNESATVRTVAAGAIGEGGPEAVGQAAPELTRLLLERWRPKRGRAGLQGWRRGHCQGCSRAPQAPAGHLQQRNDARESRLGYRAPASLPSRKLFRSCAACSEKPPVVIIVVQKKLTTECLQPLRGPWNRPTPAVW
ncbi:unnamed protein product, partial [Prorocentrum cordatum]